MYELFSNRIKRESGEIDIYIYNSFPERFRTQFFYILDDWLTRSNGSWQPEIWNALAKGFAREVGLKFLGCPNTSSKQQVEDYINNASDADFLDFMDYSVAYAVEHEQFNALSYILNQISPDTALHLEELNYRFKQHGLGYEYVNAKLVRKDTEYIHMAAIKPALHLLFDTRFEGAESEFVMALEYLHEGKNKDAIHNALKSFESTMKAICDDMGFPYSKEKDCAKALITILEQNHFYPAYMSNHLSSLRVTLESGLPTVRNKASGHGQGKMEIEIPTEFAEYAINLAAVNIVFLVNILKRKTSLKQGGIS